MRPRARLNEKTMAERAREKEREIAFTAFTGFSPPPPSRDFARCGRKGHSNSRLLSRWVLACGSRVTSHNYPKWGACSRATYYGELLRKKNKTRSSIFNESWQDLCFLQPPSPKMKRRTPSESLEKGWKKLSRPEMHV